MKNRSLWKKVSRTACFLSLACLLIQCSFPGAVLWDSGETKTGRLSREMETLISRVEVKRENASVSGGKLSIAYPYDGSLFPPEIASPTITWTDEDPRSRFWLVAFRFEGGRPPIFLLTEERTWTPGRETWEAVKDHSKEKAATLTVTSLPDRESGDVLSEHSISIRTSGDTVGDTVLFRQLPLPFAVASRSFEKTRWRLGDISSYEKPATVMKGISVCASCHVVSSDGKWISMEYNYGDDNGAQFITEVRRDIVLGENDFFTWSDFPRSGVIPPTRGLFGRMSPTGRYAAASVNEISYAAVMNDLDYSQLFFPTFGVIAVYDSKGGSIRLLPGASDYEFVQSNPAWSPDEKHILFCRAKTKNEVHANILKVTTVFEKRDIHELNKLYNIQYDLYRVPFDGGRGGVALPLKGASGNGMSNYFPRYSPDGKWVVYTRSRSGSMLQPDSELWIVPAGGGKARRMQCNRKIFNSWHSWSSNGRWLLFSSKANGPYTEIFLTHVDGEGNDTPPVLLSRFSDNGYAANVPEFVPLRTDAIRSIRVLGP
ncbi:MAG: hypothetical protein CVU61_04455 [Deltaproteobacteria bacterium HGW-Deltaproteobacteria-19]|nr:MAG: hypothetical protein CVU61_04455 [Deltaproteobacteria bacterium HGW-Deltaproteobacteria-19]